MSRSATLAGTETPPGRTLNVSLWTAQVLLAGRIQPGRLYEDRHADRCASGENGVGEQRALAGPTHWHLRNRGCVWSDPARSLQSSA